ncbi:malate dehydrogenase (quinone) [Kushneria indalinina]|uniref:Probable malate:quinone oxidoreductase n=1 Tax=Kushneria indalinina DSM 14324 TaxID=1122140 RepID=A0A3D9DU56_9GAMM|nr:malate dehydrogenase (quinone) [Kushneria indalinina]REC94293.1 malate dehydrogenase (quinone) [Kushneria indalinina DSM 14324]
MKKKLTAALCLNLCVFSGYAMATEEGETIDVALIGGGIMSATLGTYLEALQPDWKVNLYERLDHVAEESSNGWNNAGTGHSAFAEMNYTPQRDDGSVDVSRPPKITEAFEITRQFLSYQVLNGVMHDPGSFLNNTPHMSFVWGDDHIDFLRKRYEGMQQSSLYKAMEYSEDPEVIREWAPLMMEGRDPSQKVAATRMEAGTDAEWGEVTRQLISALSDKHDNFSLSTGSEVRDLERNDDGSWKVTWADLNDNNEEHSINARHVFIGAGGAALPLLQKSGIPEGNIYAGFPVGGQFLVTSNPEIAHRHHAKAYGLAASGSPPMSVPHLDSRKLDGQQRILFGPFANFSTKFLKDGSWTDLFGSMTTSNTLPMMKVGLDNFSLVKYLVGQVMLSEDDRFEALKAYYPEAKREDWTLINAGQRVQIIKKDPEKGSVLQFGTEVVTSQDGTMSALLGASPGASTAPTIMLGLMERVFPEQLASDQWQGTLKRMIPSYGQKLDGNEQLTNEIRAYTSSVLELGDTQPTAENAERIEALKARARGQEQGDEQVDDADSEQATETVENV